MGTTSPAATSGVGRSAPAALAALLTAAALALLDRRVGVGEPPLPDVTVAGEARLVGDEVGREPEEADPDHRPDPDDLRGEDEEVVEHEKRLDDEQAERDQAGPPQPLPHLEVRRVAVERARPDVVEDRQDDEQEERSEPGRLEDVREVGTGE